MKILEEMKAALAAQSPLIQRVDRVVPPEAPEVRVTPVCPFQVGQRVGYRYPTNIRGGVCFDWQDGIGTVYEITHTLEMATVSPTNEGNGWRQVPWVYIRADVEGHGDGRS